MKKIVLIILCLLVFSVFSSCFSENGAEQSNEKRKIGITDSITSSTVATTDKTEQNTSNNNIKNNKKQIVDILNIALQDIKNPPYYIQYNYLWYRLLSHCFLHSLQMQILKTLIH